MKTREEPFTKLEQQLTVHEAAGPYSPEPRTSPGERIGRKGVQATMCMSCGCGEPHERHGDQRNIVYADLKKAADASKISVKEAVQNIEKTLRTKKPRMPAA